MHAERRLRLWVQRRDRLRRMLETTEYGTARFEKVQKLYYAALRKIRLWTETANRAEMYMSDSNWNVIPDNALSISRVT